MKKKSLTIAPMEVELMSSGLPSINFYESKSNYGKICDDLGMNCLIRYFGYRGTHERIVIGKFRPTSTLRLVAEPPTSVFGFPFDDRILIALRARPRGFPPTILVLVGVTFANSHGDSCSRPILEMATDHIAEDRECMD